ncbi:ABC-2 family transporter protein [Clostridium bornimense]|uniref:ABC transporter permease n=1 Tax=Clostridium bornimense TaxID=1216932 RepID=UPI001C105EB8|nr:ABC-2 family transporter protein [Clostridium bornimense]MBU5317327.1 ABC-2 family transporter protein [Clostridium bornimense]
MKRYFEIIKSYFKYSLMMEMEYKFNFFFGGIFELVWLVMYIIFIDVIFLGSSNIGGWSKYQVLLLTFQGGLTDALVTFSVVPGLSQIPEFVNTGKLDFVLLKPLNTRFHLSLRNFSLSQIKNIIINIFGIIYCIIKLKLPVTPKLVIGYIILTISGIVIIYSIMFVLMTFSFWIIKMDIVMGVCAELITVGNKPYTIYPKIFQKIITYGLPILVAFNYPILFLCGNKFRNLIIVSAIISIIWFILANIILKRGLRKYVSTGC